MGRAGQVVIFRFPQTDMNTGKLRPALLIERIPGPYDDWLITMISSRLRHFISGFDEIVQPEDEDFKSTGLKVESVIRVGRLAVVDGGILLGAIGDVAPARLVRIKTRLADWLMKPWGVTRSDAFL